MVHTARVLASLALAVSLSAAQAVCAQEAAPGGPLPAAAVALGIDAHQVLSAREAGAIRGGGISVETSGVAVHMAGVGRWSNAIMALAGVAGGRSVTISIDGTGLRFRTDGAAIVGDHSRFQGVLATRTGVFNGYVAFQGSTSTLSVIAVPGMFAVDFR